MSDLLTLRVPRFTGAFRLVAPGLVCGLTACIASEIESAAARQQGSLHWPFFLGEL